MESTCGHDPVEKNVFSSRISLNHPTEFSVATFYLYAAPAMVPSSPLFSEHSGARLSPVKAFPSPALLGICLRSSLPLRPWPCGASSSPDTVYKGFSLCLYAPVWWWGASHKHLHSRTGLDIPPSVLGSFKPIESDFLCLLTVPLWELSPAFKLLWMKAIYIFAFNNVFEVLKSS